MIDTENSCSLDGQLPIRFNKKQTSTNNLLSSMTASNSCSRKEKNLISKISRTVKFANTVHICLILSREELRHLDLYWKPAEYAGFKHDAVQELRAHLTSQGISAKEAIFQMYQPHDEERIEWMKQFQESQRERYLDDTDKESNSTRSPSVGENDSCDSCDLDNLDNSDEEDDKIHKDNVDGLKKHSSMKTEDSDDICNSDDDNTNDDMLGSPQTNSSMKVIPDTSKGVEKLVQYNSKNTSSNRRVSSAAHGWALPWSSTKKH